MRSSRPWTRRARAPWQSPTVRARPRERRGYAPTLRVVAWAGKTVNFKHLPLEQELEIGLGMKEGDRKIDEAARRRIVRAEPPRHVAGLGGQRGPPGQPRRLPAGLPINNDHRRGVDLPGSAVRLPDYRPAHINRLVHIRIKQPNRVWTRLVRCPGPMRVRIVEAHNGNSTARLDEGQQLSPVPPLVRRSCCLERTRQTRVESLRAQPLQGPTEELRDQRQFIAVEVKSLELLGAEPVLDKMPGQVGDCLLVLLVFLAKLGPQPSDRVDRSKQPAQAVVVALRPGSEIRRRAGTSEFGVSKVIGVREDIGGLGPHHRSTRSTSSFCLCVSP